MSISNFSPRFIKSKVMFQLDGVTHDFGEHLINLSGVPGIEWPKFDPTAQVGKKVTVALQILCAAPFRITCVGTLTNEQTERGIMMGIALSLSDMDSKALLMTTEKEGVLPDYVRKFPRIPFMKRVNVMPSNALIRFAMAEEEITAVSDVENISPTGFQIGTEDPRANCLLPGENLKVYFMPRGESYNIVNINGVIRRVTRAVDPVSGVSRISFGMSVGNISDDQRASFTHLLRKIVEQLKI